jgi:hypothetical protein
MKTPHFWLWLRFRARCLTEIYGIGWKLISFVLLNRIRRPKFKLLRTSSIDKLCCGINSWRHWFDVKDLKISELSYLYCVCGGRTPILVNTFPTRKQYVGRGWIVDSILGSYSNPGIDFSSYSRMKPTGSVFLRRGAFSLGSSRQWKSERNLLFIYLSIWKKLGDKSFFRIIFNNDFTFFEKMERQGVQGGRWQINFQIIFTK